MTIQKIICDNNLTEFRNRIWSDEDVSYLKKKLENNEINWIVKFLNVSEDLPIELLKPLIDSGINYDDVSYPKQWMWTVQRIFSPEEIDEVLFKIIRENKIEIKCRATHLFYFNGIGRTWRHRSKEELGSKISWNGQRYTLDFIEVDKEYLKAKDERIKKFLDKRYKFLIDEFLGTDNILFKYYIYLRLREVHKHEIAEEDKTIKVMNIIGNPEFPKSWSDITNLANNDSSLKLFLEEFNE